MWQQVIMLLDENLPEIVTEIPAGITFLKTQIFLHKNPKVAKAPQARVYFEKRTIAYSTKSHIFW